MIDVDTLPGLTADALERICDAHWNHGIGNGVTFSKITQHNACNHTLSGEITVDGIDYGFTIDNGDWAGTVVRSWEANNPGFHADPPAPEPRTFIPRDRDLFNSKPAMWGVYLYWRKQPWFTDMERGYNYDRHFQPGGFVENHYREKAEKRGLVPGYLSDLTEAERESIVGKVVPA